MLLATKAASAGGFVIIRFISLVDFPILNQALNLGDINGASDNYCKWRVPRLAKLRMGWRATLFA